MEPRGTSHELERIFGKTSHPEPHEVVYYKSQIPYLKFHQTWVCEEHQQAKLCRKPWIYQEQQLVLYSHIKPYTFYQIKLSENLQFIEKS